MKGFDTSKLPRLDEGWLRPRNKQFDLDPAPADKSFQQFIRGVAWAGLRAFAPRGRLGDGRGRS
jgi:hypothetical protein